MSENGFPTAESPPVTTPGGSRASLPELHLDDLGAHLFDVRPLHRQFLLIVAGLDGLDDPFVGLRTPEQFDRGLVEVARAGA